MKPEAERIQAFWDVIVIGGGPAGLAAALAADRTGASVLIIERGPELGGILNQCIHTGFGLHEFKDELTGPEYARRFIDQIEGSPIRVLLDAMVIDLTDKRQITAVQAGRILHLEAKAIVLAMGCRERTAGAISLCGSRPGGIFTAGMAQKLANEEGYLVGREIIIYGSGDIGLIMARRMTLEGAHVGAVVEIMPISSGLPRNIAQCLDDFAIPLKLSTAIAQIHGVDRVTGVTLIQVDEDRHPIHGTEETMACDTLLLSVGLIPESELATAAGIVLHPVTGGPLVDSHLMTSVPGIFAAGNTLHVHDIVDFVSAEARTAGLAAARHALGSRSSQNEIQTEAGPGIRYVVPDRIEPGSGVIRCSMRPEQIHRDGRVLASQDENQLTAKRFRVINPSEVIQLDLDTGRIDGAGGPIRFEVEAHHD